MTDIANATITAAASTPGEVAWSWKRPATRHVACYINGYVRLAIVEVIRKGLQAAGGHGLVSRFRDSCFGHFLRPTWATGAPGYTAIHSLFTNEVILPGAGEDSFTFRIGKKFIKFGREEYALITGLRFGATDFDLYSIRAHSQQSVYARYSTAVSVSGDRLKDNFQRGVFRGSEDDSLKVAKVLAAYFLVLGLDGQKKIPDQWLWHLVEDQKRWESFPWGAYSWDRLRHYIRDIPIDIEGRKLYHVYGNLYAVLVWAVEAVPDLLGRLAVKIDGAEPMPRMTRYTFPRGQKYDYTAYFDSERECIQRLVPCPEEEAAVYFQDLDVPLPPCARYLHIGSTKKRTKTPKNTTVLDFDDDDDGDEDAATEPARKRVCAPSRASETVRQGTQGQVGEVSVREVPGGTNIDVPRMGKVDERADKERVDARTDEDDTRTRRLVPDQEALLHRIALMLTEERHHITDDVRREGDRALHGIDRMRGEIWSEMRNELNRMRVEIQDEFAKQKEYIHGELVKLRDENRMLKEEIRRGFQRLTPEHHSFDDTNARRTRPQTVTAPEQSTIQVMIQMPGRDSLNIRRVLL